MSPDLSPYLPQSSGPPKACFSECAVSVKREGKKVKANQSYQKFLARFHLLKMMIRACFHLSISKSTQMNEHKKNLKGFALALLIIAISGINSRSICQNCGTTCQTVKDVNTIVHNGNNYPTIYHKVLPMTSISTYESTNHFRVYFADDLPFLNNSTLANGFDRTSLHGVVRRQTFLAVLDYLETVINIPNGVILDLFVDYSYDYAAPISPDVNWIAMGAPIYPPGFNTQQGVYTPYIQTHILSGTDPNTGTRAYDGYLQFSFRNIISSGNCHKTWDDYSFNTSYIENGRIDLFTVILHQMLHVLGINSNIRPDQNSPNNPPVATNNSFSNFDANFLYYLTTGKHPDPANFLPLVINPGSNPVVNPALTLINSPLYSGRIWLNSMEKPDNHGISPMAVDGINLSHLNKDLYNHGQFSPGYVPDYVLTPDFYNNYYQRSISLPEIRILNTLGYSINIWYTNAVNNSPVYTNQFAYSTLTPDLTNPVPPNGSAYFPDEINPQYTITNNNTTANPNNTTLTIHIDDFQLGIIDNENDPVYFLKNSLFGIQGVSSYGNNHDQLVVAQDGYSISFTPLPEYYGISQFGIRVSDGIEYQNADYTGALLIITIQINPGNFTISPGDELVINGGYEDGTELRQIGPFQNNPYTGRYTDNQSGEFFSGIVLSGAHPFSWQPSFTTLQEGDIVKDIYYPFSLAPSPASIPAQFFGHGGSSVSSSVYSSVNFAPLTQTSGDRYHFLKGENNYFLLKNQVKSCTNYNLSFDLCNKSSFPSPYTYYVEFIDPSVPFDPDNPAILQTIPFTISGNGTEEWHHWEFQFLYCDLPSRMFRIRNPYSFPNNEIVLNRVFIDNVSLTEQNPLAFNIIHDNPNICHGDDIQLSIQTIICPNSTFEWYSRYNGGTWTLCSTTTIPNLILTPNAPGTYEFKVNIVTTSCTTFSSNILSVIVPDAIHATHSQTDEDCYASADGEISLLTITGGTPAYTWEWYYQNTLMPTVSNQATLSDLKAGVYEAIIEDNHGCIQTYPINLLDSRPELWPLQPKSQDSKDRGTAITSDPDGNVYVAGKFDSNIGFYDPGFNTISLSNSNGYGGLYLAGIDQCGYTNWAQKISVEGADITDMVYDNENIYICGEFYYTMIFDPANTNLTLTSTGNKDLFLACYNSSGVFQWARQISGSDDNDQLKAVCVDNYHNIYITGSFKSPSLSFQTNGIIYNSNTLGNTFDAYIGKYTPTGIFLNASAYGTANEDNISNDITFTEPQGGYLVIIGRNGNDLGGYKVSSSLFPFLTYSGPFGYEGLAVCYQDVFLNIVGKSFNSAGENYFKARTNSINPIIINIEDFGLLGPIFSIEYADVLATNNNSFFILGNTLEADLNYPLANPILTFANSSPSFVEHFLIKQDLNPNPQNWIQRSEGMLNEVALKMARTANGNIFYTGFFDMECILGQSLLSSNDQDSYIARVIDEQLSGNYAKPNLGNQGVSKSMETSIINLYPNPCSDILTIHSELFKDTQKSQIHISDITGRKIITLFQPGDGIDQLNVPTTSLIPGLYFITFYNTIGVFKTKFIKQ